MPQHKKLKSLYHQKEHHKDKLTKLDQECRIAAAAYNEEKKKLESIEKQIVKFQNQGECAISDHATVLYLERVVGYDMQALRKALLPDHVRKLHDELGDGTFPCGTHEIVIQDNKVLTVKV